MGMSIDDITDAHEYGIQELALRRQREIIARARLAVNDEAQWSAKELKALIADLLRVTGL